MGTLTLRTDGELEQQLAQAATAPRARSCARCWKRAPWKQKPAFFVTGDKALLEMPAV